MQSNQLNTFIKRNHRRNAPLYSSDLTEGFDYVVCPVSKSRMSMIKSSYIEKVLGMTVSDYDLQYPGARKVSEKRKSNIKSGLQIIDPIAGMSKYDISQTKSRAILNQVDSNGQSGYARKGQKTKATHMRNVDEHGRNGYRQQADARLTTVLENGLTVEQNAHIKQRDTLVKNHKTGTGGASKISKKILLPLLEYLSENNIRYYFDSEEYGIKDKFSSNYYFYDLTIPEFLITIEYQSAAWHANPTWDDLQWATWSPPRGVTKTANDALQYDYAKAKALFKNRGIVTHYVWEDSSLDDITGILCLLKTMNTKY